MNIAYSYEVVFVDEVSRTMELRYTSEGRAPVHVGARLPYAGESLDAIASMYSPARLWEEQNTAVVVPVIGASGAYLPAGAMPTTLESAREKKKAQAASARYLAEVGGVVFAGSAIRTDRESQAQLSSAYTALKNGLLPGVDWKTSDGEFVTLALAQVEAIAQAVAAHVQSSFTMESSLCAAIDLADTIEQVEAIAIPAYMANSGTATL